MDRQGVNTLKKEERIKILEELRANFRANTVRLRNRMDKFNISWSNLRKLASREDFGGAHQEWPESVELADGKPYTQSNLLEDYDEHTRLLHELLDSFRDYLTSQ